MILIWAGKFLPRGIALSGRGRAEQSNCPSDIQKTEGPFMLSRCANDQCCKPFLKLRDGKLFLVESEGLTKPGAAAPPFVRARKQQRKVEHFWLCDECATRWTLVCDRDHGIALAPLRRPATQASASSKTQSGVA